MGREILQTGKVHVWRGDRDAEELQQIRAGRWSYDELVQSAEAELATLAESERGGTVAVPKRVDRNAIDGMVIELVETHLQQRGAK